MESIEAVCLTIGCFISTVQPFDHVLERLRQLGPFPKPEELDSLLPWSEELPEEIKTKTKPKK